MLHTFGTVKCSEAEINYDVQYEDCDCYFNKDTLETENIEVVLEIMQLYDGSLNKYLDKLNLSKKKFYENIFCLVNCIFMKIGFFHNDIHLRNILLNLIPKSKEPEALIYEMQYKIYSRN